MKLVWERERVHLSIGQHGRLSAAYKIICTYGFLSRVPTGRVIFEIGGAPVREELARDGRVVLLPFRISANCPCSTSPGG
jgi:hypothetical protein